MRTILMIAALVVSQFAQATDMPISFWPETVMLAEGSATLTPITGQVVSRKPMCPKGKICIQNGTNLKIKFALGGCMDTLSNVTHLVDYTSRTVYVSAQNVGNKESMVTMCIAQPFAVVTIPVHGLDGKFNVRYVGTEDTVIY
jgi:hypothetical protein